MAVSSLLDKLIMAFSAKTPSTSVASSIALQLIVNFFPIVMFGVFVPSGVETGLSLLIGEIGRILSDTAGKVAQSY